MKRFTSLTILAVITLAAITGGTVFAKGSLTPQLGAAPKLAAFYQLKTATLPMDDSLSTKESEVQSIDSSKSSSTSTDKSILDTEVEKELSEIEHNTSGFRSYDLSGIEHSASTFTTVSVSTSTSLVRDDSSHDSSNTSVDLSSPDKSSNHMESPEHSATQPDDSPDSSLDR